MAPPRRRPEIKLGDHRNFRFAPEIDRMGEPKVARVIGELFDE